MTAMKVLFITRKYPPSIGGMQLFAHELYTALSAKTNMQLIKWGGSNKALPLVYPLLFFKGLHHLAKGGVDVIHIQDGLLAPAGWLLSKLSRKPYTVVIHGLDITFANPLFKVLAPRAVARAAAVFCISQAAADEAAARGVPREKLLVIPLAVEDKLYGRASRDNLLQQLDLPHDSQMLLTVGRLVKRKGVAWFITAVLPQLVQQYPRVVHLVVGEGSERPVIEAAITAAGMADHVRLLGRVTDQLYEAAYNGADVFVMPNIPVPNNLEGFGLVVLEASLCAVPVVAAATDGITDAVSNGHNGLLVPVQDAAAFAQTIGQLLNDPVAAKQFGQQSRAFTLAHYQWPAIAERYLEVYKNLQSRR